MSMGSGSKFFGAPPNDLDDPMNGLLVPRPDYEVSLDASTTYPRNQGWVAQRSPILEPRRSPSPGPSRGPPHHDGYAPPTRLGLSFRANGYDPNRFSSDSWHTARSLRQRSSTGSYEPHHPAGGWSSRPTYGWSEPYQGGSLWPERRPPPVSPVQREFGRGRDMMAESMLEPSEAWKQTHVCVQSCLLSSLCMFIVPGSLYDYDCL